MPATNSSLIGNTTKRRNGPVVEEEYCYRIMVVVGERLYWYSAVKGSFHPMTRYARIFDTEAAAQVKCQQILHQQPQLLTQFPLWAQPEVQFVRADELRTDVQLTLSLEF